MCKGACLVVAALIGVIVGVLSGLPTIWAVTLAILVFIFGYWALNRWLCGKGEVIAAAASAPMAAPKPAPASAPTPAPAAAPADAAPEPAAAPAPAPAVGSAAHWSAAIAADSGKAGSGRGQTGLKPSAALAEEETVRDDVGSWKYESDAAPYRAATPPPGPGAGGGYAPAAAPAPAPAPAADVAEAEPEILSAARDGTADDLKQIKGVGPGLEKTLNDLGFYHFDQIAAWGPAEVAWVDARLKFKGRIERDGWIAQAAELAKG
ncbi:MAG: hypothetical protein AAFN79_00400 [Pseudomonadota bacterium]